MYFRDTQELVKKNINKMVLKYKFTCKFKTKVMENRCNKKKSIYKYNN